MPQEATAQKAGTQPVQPDALTDGDGRPPERGIALCLSGGGYRAMLFHLGSVWRLFHAGALPRLDRVSSVSGGSITAALLGLSWNDLAAGGWQEQAFVAKVVEPIRALAGHTIDVGSVLIGVFGPGTVADRILAAYARHLYGESTLQDLPDHPRFVINATNVQTMALWRFMKPYMADYRVGKFLNPEVELARAVAASSAFPPVMSPVDLTLNGATFDKSSAGDCAKPEFMERVVLTDGGVYDNLGLETAWKRYRTILVSDAGGKVSDEPSPARDWGRHAARIFEITDNQVRDLRKRQIVGSVADRQRYGAYWSVRDDVSKHGAYHALPCPAERTMELAKTPTRLAALDPEWQARLINWGYAACDAALNAWFENDPMEPTPLALKTATAFPLEGGV